MVAWAALAAAAIPALTGMKGQEDVNHTNEVLANQANATQIDLANTSFQRRVADLTKAGLNPMLAYTQGGAANPNMIVPEIKSSLGAGVHSAMAGWQNYQAQQAIESQVKTQETQQAVNDAIRIKTIADADVSVATAAEIRARTPTYDATIARTLAEIDKISVEANLNLAQTMKIKQEVTNQILQGKQIEVETGNKLADTRLKQIDFLARSKELPMSAAAGGAAETWWGRNVAPHLPSVLRGATIIDKVK